MERRCSCAHGIPFYLALWGKFKSNNLGDVAATLKRHSREELRRADSNFLNRREEKQMAIAHKEE
jgi:hypothetical protein